MPTTSIIVKEWSGSSEMLDGILKVIREMDTTTRWVIAADMLSVARSQGALLGFDTGQSLNAITQASVLHAMTAWASSRATPRTSAIPDWRLIRDWRDDLVAEVEAYRLKAAGWDGYSANPIHPQAIADAVNFIRLLPPDVPRPIDQPYADGEVSLVWRIGANFAEVVFAGDQAFSWYATNSCEEASGENLPLHSGVPADLERIMGFAKARSHMSPPFASVMFGALCSPLVTTSLAPERSWSSYWGSNTGAAPTADERSWPIDYVDPTIGIPQAPIAYELYLDRLEPTV